MELCLGPWAMTGRCPGPQPRPGLFLTSMGFGLFIHINGYLDLEVMRILGDHLFEVQVCCGACLGTRTQWLCGYLVPALC